MSTTRSGRRGHRKPRFGISRKNGLVHRFKDDESGRLFAKWLCGGSAAITTIVKNPPADNICQRCETMSSGPVVYHCYSADGRLLYIGSCIFWAARAATHRRQTPWWSEVARVDTASHPDLPAARRAERRAIWAEAPLYNKQHNDKRFRQVGNRYVPVPYEVAA